MVSEKLRNRIIAAVVVVWVTNFAMTLIPGIDYKADPFINGIMLTAVGGVIGASVRGGNGHGKGEAPGGPE